MHFKKVIEILANKKRLNKTKIAITEDFPPETMEIRKNLIPIMLQLRKENNHAYIKYDTLIVNGKPYQQNTDPKKRLRSEENTSEVANTQVTPPPAGPVQNINKKLRGQPKSTERKPATTANRNTSVGRIKTNPIPNKNNLQDFKGLGTSTESTFSQQQQL